MALRPQFTASVGPAAGATNPGAGGNPYQQADPLAGMRALMKANNRQIDYDPVFNNIYEDKTLAAFRAETGGDSAESDEYFKAHAAAYCEQYLAQAKVYRRGRFYMAVREIFDNYHIIGHNPATQGSMVKKEFTTYLNSRLDLSDRIVVNASFWYGMAIMQRLKASDQGNLPERECIQLSQNALLNVLNIEIVIWMHGSSIGKRFLHHNTPEIQDLLGKFNARKEMASTVFQMFNEVSPYDGANFRSEGRSSEMVTSIMPELSKYGIQQRLDVPGEEYSGAIGSDYDELARIAFDNVNRDRNAIPHYDMPVQRRAPVEEDVGGFGYTAHRTYGAERNDLQNITLKNRNEFNIRRYFKKTGVDDWYVVDESDWKYLRNVIRRSPMQRAEQSLLQNCLRIVNLDFKDDDETEGWVSRAIRIDEVDKDMILSDPEKLLPLIDGDVDPLEGNLKVMDAKQFFDAEGAKLGPDAVVFDELREPNFDFRVIKNDEHLVSENSSDIMETLQVAGHSIAQETKQPVVIFSEYDIESGFMCESAQKRERIEQRFPMLFATGEEPTEDISYFHMIETLREQLKRAPIDSQDTPPGDRFDTMLINRLTTDINNWLINACGYAADIAYGRTLIVDNIFDDLEALKKNLLAKDREVYDILNKADKESLIKEQIKIFKPYEATNLTGFTLEKHVCRLKRFRHYKSLVIANQPAPRMKENELCIIRRSSYPEFFSLVDELQKDLNKQNKSLRTANITVLFKNTNSLFMLTPNVYDPNVIILRTIIMRRSLINPLYG